jgi:hypothetical protein
LSRPEKRYRIILNADDNEILSDAGRRETERLKDGECFLFSVNRLSNMPRGKSDIMRLLDWLDGYEEFMFENLERVGKHLMTFIWDILYKGLTEEQIQKKMAAMRPPRRGSMRGHNENVAWAAVAPDLKSQDVHTIIQFGDPEDANRAVAAEMNDPPVVKLSARQLYMVYAVKEMARYQLAQARKKGTLTKDLVQLLDADDKPQGDPVPLAEAFTVTAPEISRKDTTAIATSLSQLSTSLVIAQQEGWLGKRKAAELFAAVASQLGPEIDVSREVQDERVTADYVDQLKIRRLADLTQRRRDAGGQG